MEILERLAKIEAKLDDYADVQKESREAHAMALENKRAIAEIRENSRWANRTSWTAIILPILYFIVTHRLL